jgi:rhodanese-related sulfurtransferase
MYDIEANANQEDKSALINQTNAPKAIFMITTFVKNDPAKALKYFEDKMAFTTGPIELNRAINEKQDIVVVDVRAAEDFKQGHIGVAVSLPRHKWSNPSGLRKDKLNVIYCYSHVCHLGAAAGVELARQGFPVMEMDGGIAAWTKHNLPVER